MIIHYINKIKDHYDNLIICIQHIQQNSSLFQGQFLVNEELNAGTKCTSLDYLKFSRGTPKICQIFPMSQLHNLPLKHPFPSLHSPLDQQYHASK